MSGLHYKKDGSLDMRYSSSKAAVASGGSSYGGGSSSYGGGSSSYGGGSSSYGGGSSSYGGGIHSSTSSYGSSSSHSSYSSPASSDLHYKKDGSLDMRYASSRQATASGSYTPSPAASSGYSSSGNDSLHYKKDGSLDMRYSSSKQATASGNYNLSPAASSGYSSSGNDSLHYKKDGSLDMRYSSSKQVTAGISNTSPPAASSRLPSHQPASVGQSSGELHYKKDGSLDMRYRSSKSAIDAVTGELDKINLKPATKKPSILNIPDYVPTKTDGTPDMRTRAAKEWVATQAANWHGNGVPSWVPQDKFGAINMQSAVGCAFARACPPKPNVNDRGQYWSNRLLDEDFFDSVAEERQEPVMLPPRPPVLPDPVPLKYEQASSSSSFSASEDDNPAPIPEGASLIDYEQLVFEQDKEEKAVLGRGSFGVVLKAKLYGVDADVGDAGAGVDVKSTGIDVAVKKLHLEQLTTKEKRTFRKELIILAHLGSHPNLVKLYAYCLNPPCLVMELVKMGSLTHLLHYCEDPKIEAKITDGRVKKKIIFGIANGMLQLHTAKVIHGDLKPQNVLITETYEAKLADFGLAYFRGKTSSTVASKKMETDEKESREEIGGTAGYMAPELLDSVSPPEFSSDVYSFGIVLNEVVSEEEPFSDQYANFAARGPFGAANYAKQGMRPTIGANTPDIVKQLITSCWAANAALRPTFKDIVAAIETPKFVIPNSF